MRNHSVVFMVALLLAAPVGLAGDISANSNPTTSVTVSLDDAVGDTFVLKVTAENELVLASEGHVAVEGDFSKDDELQRISALVSTVRDEEEIACGEITGTFVGGDSAGVRTGVQGAGPCFMGLYGSQIDDVSASTDPDEVGDVRVMGGPGLQVEAQTEHSAYDTLTIGVGYGEGTVFPLPDGASEATFHFLITIPDAETLNDPWWGSAVNLEFEGDVTNVEHDVQEAGFSVWADEMEPVGVQAPFLSTYYSNSFLCGSGCGHADQQLGGKDDAVYAAMGHTWGGHNNIHNPLHDGVCQDCLFVPTVATGSYGYVGPDRSASTNNAGVSTGGPIAPLVTAVGTPSGDYTFWVDHYLGTGNQDLLTVGLAADLP